MTSLKMGPTPLGIRKHSSGVDWMLIYSPKPQRFQNAATESSLFTGATRMRGETGGQSLVLAVGNALGSNTPS